MIQRIFINVSSAAIVLVGAASCDGDGNSDLESIDIADQGSGGGQACQPDARANATFENNFGLENYCIEYSDQGSGLVEFNFVKEAAAGVGRFAITIPHTQVGHVFSFNTQKMMALHANHPDHCEMLKSASEYPRVDLMALDGKEMVAASSLDSDKNNFFDVTVNTLKVAEKPGEMWLYELSATYARQDHGPFYLKGRFEVMKR